jgi:hypothetical protein
VNTSIETIYLCSHKIRRGKNMKYLRRKIGKI